MVPSWACSSWPAEFDGVLMSSVARCNWHDKERGSCVCLLRSCVWYSQLVASNVEVRKKLDKTETERTNFLSHLGDALGLSNEERDTGTCPPGVQAHLICSATSLVLGLLTIVLVVGAGQRAPGSTWLGRMTTPASRSRPFSPSPCTAWICVSPSSTLTNQRGSFGW